VAILAVTDDGETTPICIHSGLRGARLDGTTLGHPNLAAANLEGAALGGANLRHAVYDADTRWPEGFDPQAAGVRQLDEDDAPGSVAPAD
jgi:hypothetical protein